MSWKDTTWEGLNVQEAINLPEEEYSVLIKRLPTSDLDALVDAIEEYSAWRDSVFAEAERRGMDVDKIVREAASNA